jgi:hypothetical protein
MRRGPVRNAEAQGVASSAEVVEAGPAEAAAAMPVGAAVVAGELGGAAPVAMPEGQAAVAKSVAEAEAVANPEAEAAEPVPSGLPLPAARHRDNREGLPLLPLSPARRKWGIRSGKVERRVRIADRSS